MNGSQKRRPSEVFLNPLKNISEEQIKDIFYIEKQMYENNKATGREHSVGETDETSYYIKSLNFQDDGTS